MMVPTPSQHEYSVTELSNALKQTVEGTFSSIRVRGEISGFKHHSSGHCYLRLKDETAVLDAVIWKSVVLSLELSPSEGLEVVVTGRITTYHGRSSYQILIDSMIVSGTGALLKLLDERRRRLSAEGLFDASRKKKPPFLPQTIGIITSPTGAAIRDILHCLNERFPRQVILWPVMVQGKEAAVQIAAAISGFNQLQRIQNNNQIRRPDVIIVARGGGSLEDLWPFNEDVVVRAAAASAIPLVSAIGHETDITLIDLVADKRAPTPTAAVEMVVPVRFDLLTQVRRCINSLTISTIRLLKENERQIERLGQSLPDPKRLIEDKTLRLDDCTERLVNSIQIFLKSLQSTLIQYYPRLPRLQEKIISLIYRYKHVANSLYRVTTVTLSEKGLQLEHLAFLMNRTPLSYIVSWHYSRGISNLSKDLSNAISRLLIGQELKLNFLARILEDCSVRSILGRGFVLLLDSHSKVIGSILQSETRIIQTAIFHDGVIPVKLNTDNGSYCVRDHNRVRELDEQLKRRSRKRSYDPSQGSLF